MSAARPERDGADPLQALLRALPPRTPVTAGLTAGELCAEVDALAATLAVAPGEPVGYQAPNGEAWIVGLLGLLHAGATPVLLNPEAPRMEADRLLAAASARRELRVAGGYRLVGEPGAEGARGVLLATSGTTGAPKLVLRDVRSLVAEGERYRVAAGLDGTDRLVLPLPLTHAYALGWLVAALVSGTQVIALPPTALSAVADELADGATILALVPTVARLLALRARRTPLAAPKLRLAMVGAGAVDERLEADCRSAFGIPTGRNYGSTETGAVFAGLADLPPLCVGQPMPGVRFRIVDDAGTACPAGDHGLLEVSTSDTGAGWRPTGDLAVADELGRVRILGRQHGSVRRGGRWVAPAEVELVLREHPLVTDVNVRVRRGRFADEDALVADVAAGGPVDEAELLAFARERLSAYKVPARITVRAELDRDAIGKAAVAAPRYRLGDPAAVTAAMRAYRRSEALFALAGLGAIDLLRDGADLDRLTGELGVPADSLRRLLDIAVDLGVLRTDGTAGDEPPAGFDELLALEAELSRTWLTRDAIAGAVRGGHARPFDTADLGEALPRVYRAAMHGPHTTARTRLGLRLLGGRARGRVLEVTAGPGRYLAGLLGVRADLDGCHLTQVGRLAGAPLPALAGRVAVGDDPPAGVFDACVVANGVHGPGPGADPAWLLDRLAPGGVLLVDDLFLPGAGEQGAELGLDWFTHGGTAWPRVEQWLSGLAAAGGTVVRRIPLTPPECCVILAKG